MLPAALAGALAMVLSTVNVNRLTVGMLTALLMLSLVPLTGWAGQISLAQMTFAGVGAYAMAKVGGDGTVVGIIAAGVWLRKHEAEVDAALLRLIPAPVRAGLPRYRRS